MAKVAILIEDLENEGVSVNVSTDTEVTEEGALTTAQTLGAVTVQFLQSMIHDDSAAEDEIAEVDAAATEQLTLTEEASADEPVPAEAENEPVAEE